MHTYLSVKIPRLPCIQIQLFYKGFLQQNLKYRSFYVQQSQISGDNIAVKTIMDTWVLQMNFPVVTVQRRSTGQYHVRQKRFLINPGAKDPMTYTSKYGYS